MILLSFHLLTNAFYLHIAATRAGRNYLPFCCHRLSFLECFSGLPRGRIIRRPDAEIVIQHIQLGVFIPCLQRHPNGICRSDVTLIFEDSQELIVNVIIYARSFTIQHNPHFVERLRLVPDLKSFQFFFHLNRDFNESALNLVPASAYDFILDIHRARAFIAFKKHADTAGFRGAPQGNQLIAA
jgi:hypothetical protein